MQSDGPLLDQLAAVLDDAGLGIVGHADILDLDFEDQLGLGSIEIAELAMRVERAYEVKLPAERIWQFRRPRDLLEAIIQAPSGASGAGAAVLGQLPRVGPTYEASSPRALELSGSSTLLELIRIRAEKHGDHPHLRFLGPDGQLSELTYGQLWDRGTRAAAGMASVGFRPGERVAILAATGPEFFVAFVAALCAGGVPVPIYPPVRLDDLDGYSQRQSRILRNSEASMIICDPVFKAAADLLRIASPCVRETGTVAALASSSAGPYCVEKAAELALIQYTSGSTGSPKGVALTHANLLANMQAITDGNLTASDVAVSWMPLYHDFGLIACWMGGAILAGTSVVMMSPVDFLTEPARWLWAIDRFRATVIATPTFGLDFARRRVSDDQIAGLDLSSIKLAVLGAEPIRASVLDEFCHRFEPYGFRRAALAPAYGLAESCVAVTLARSGEQGPRVDCIDAQRLAADGRAELAGSETHVHRIVSVGSPIGDQQVRVTAAEGGFTEALEDRREGRVLVRGRSVMSGYFNDPETTASAFRGDWLDTGDLGYMADGELFITGRAKDVIIKAGRNYHPHDIEHAVSEVPGVRKGCVIAFGETMAEYGEGIVVVAETSVGAAEQVELKAAIRAAVVRATGTTADDIVLIARGGMLKTSSGKLRRRETRQAYNDGTLGKSATGGRRQLYAAVARIGWHRLRRSLPAAKDVVVGTYLSVATMSMMLLTALGAVGIRDRAAMWRFSRRVLATLFASTRMSFRVTGAPFPDGPAVFVSNHASDMDPLLLVSAFERPVWMIGKKRLFKGLFGLVAGRLGVIPVDTQSVESSLASYERLRTLLASGESVHVFPEGNRRSNPGVYPFRLGAFKLAADTGTPLVPLALRGPREVMRGRPYRPAALEVVVLPPVEVDCAATDLAALGKVRADVRRLVAEACGEPLIDTRSLKGDPTRDSIATRFTTGASLGSAIKGKLTAHRGRDER